MAIRWFWLILVSALSLPCVVAANDADPLALEVGSGVVWGSAGELVFDPALNRNENDPISLLTWPVPPSYQLALTAKMRWVPWLTTSVTVQGAWPVMTGTMSDEDWRVQTFSDFLVYGRSESQTYVTSHWSTVVEQNTRWAGVTLGLGGLYKTIQWEAWHGTKRYEYTTGVSESQFHGLVLEYRQVWYIPFVSAGWTASFDQWTFTPSLRFSPYTWCFDTDNHMFAAKRITYLDNLRGGWYGLAGLELTFPPLMGLTMGLRGTWEAAWGAVGDTYAIEPQSVPLGASVSTEPSVNGAGGRFQEAAFSLFVRN